MRLFRTKSVWVRGEDAAARFMKRSGHRILARNLRLPIGEIDLLCLDPKSGTIVIVEVKARLVKPQATKRIDPMANIGSHKQHKLRTLARAIKKNPRFAHAPIRIDAIGVVFAEHRRSPVEIKHYQAAVGA